MKYFIVNGKKYLVKDNGEVSNVEVTDTQASEMTEAKPEEVKTPENATTEANNATVEQATEELKGVINSTIKSQVGNAVKSINAIKGIENSVKDAIVDAFKSENKSVSGFMTEDEKKSLTVDEVVKGMKAVKESNGKSFSFYVKTLTELNSLTGNVILEDRLAGVDRAPVRNIFVEQLCNVSATGSDKVTYVEATTQTGSPATTAELAAMPDEDFEFEVFEAPVRKITVKHSASNEILEDAPQLVSKVREWLNEDMNLKAEDKILFGPGTANEFKGIKTVATTFAAGNFATAIPNANNYDVIRVAIQQIMNASKDRYIPTEILMNSEDVTKMELTKDANGNYVMPPFTSADKTVIKNVKVVETPAITAGEFLIGDFRKANVANRRGLTVQIATENKDDFEKDMITIRLTRRFAFYVRNNDVGAFVKGVFATAKTAITV